MVVEQNYWSGMQLLEASMGKSIKTRPEFLIKFTKITFKNPFISFIQSFVISNYFLLFYFNENCSVAVSEAVYG